MDGYLISPKEKYYRYIISNEIPRNLRLDEFLEYYQFDLERYAPLQFWFGLNDISNDTFFVLTDDLIEMIGFARIGLSDKHRANLLRFIRKNFQEHVHFVEEYIGSHNKIQISMKKRPFKMMLLKIGTKTSELVHEYLLDFEEHCLAYMCYEDACKRVVIEETQRELRAAPLIEDLDTSKKRVKITNINDLHRHINASTYQTTDEEDLKMVATKLGIESDKYNKLELIEKLINY